MAKYYDENGNEVQGVMTAAEAETAAAQKIKDAEAAAVETYKKEHPEPVAPAADAKNPEVEALTKTVNELSASLAKEKSDAAIARYTGGDADKEASVRAEFDKMSGYEDVGARAAAAAKVALGEAKVMTVGDYSGAGSGRTADGQNAAPLSRPADAAVQRSLGIKAEDIAKYGPQIEASEAAKTN